MKLRYVVLFLAILPIAKAQVSESEMPQILKEEGPDWCPFDATYLDTEGVIPPDSDYPSPNQHENFRIAKLKRPYQYSLEITDKTTGIKSSFDDTFYPLLQESWSPDSRTILLAQSSQLESKIGYFWGRKGVLC